MVIQTNQCVDATHTFFHGIGINTKIKWIKSTQTSVSIRQHSEINCINSSKFKGKLKTELSSCVYEHASLVLETGLSDVSSHYMQHKSSYLHVHKYKDD